MISGRGGLAFAILAAAAIPSAPVPRMEMPVPLLPKYDGRVRGGGGSQYTKRYKGGPVAAKKAAKLRKQGRKNARRGR